MIEIEKGIPIPPIRTKTGLTAALREMQVGDSVFRPGADPTGLSGVIRRVPGKFVCRKVDGGSRIWRTA